MTPSVREATSRDAGWYIEHVRTLAAEKDVQVPLRPSEFLVTHEQQAEVFDGAAFRGDMFLIAEVLGNRVGELSLRRGSRAAFKHSALLGMSVAPEWRNKGVGSALIQRAIDWATGSGGLRRVELFVYATNEPAIRLYKKYGVVVEGLRRGAIRVGDGFVDDLMMAHYVNI